MPPAAEESADSAETDALPAGDGDEPEPGGEAAQGDTVGGTVERYAKLIGATRLSGLNPFAKSKDAADEAASEVPIGDETAGEPPPLDADQPSRLEAGKKTVTDAVERYTKLVGKTRIADLNPFAKGADAETAADTGEASASDGEEDDLTGESPKKGLLGSLADSDAVARLRRAGEEVRDRAGRIDTARLKALNPFDRASSQDDESKPADDGEDDGQSSTGAGDEPADAETAAETGEASASDGGEDDLTEESESPKKGLLSSLADSDAVARLRRAGEEVRDRAGRIDTARLKALNPFDRASSQDDESKPADDGEDDGQPPKGTDDVA